MDPALPRPPSVFEVLDEAAQLFVIIARVADSELERARQLLQGGQFETGFEALDRALERGVRGNDPAAVQAVLSVIEDVGPSIRGRAQRARANRVAATARRNLGLPDRAKVPPLPRVGSGLAERPASTLDKVVEVLPATPLDSLPGKARHAIEQGLIPGEAVMTVIHGTGSTAIVGTDRRAFIVKKGYLAGATFGQKLASFDYDSIVGVEIHAGALTGAVVIHVPGASSVSTSYWRDGKSDPWKAYNAIPISRPYEAAKSGAAVLRALVAEHQSRGRASATQPPVLPTPSGGDTRNDPLEALRKLGELRAAGVVTDEEFEAKKAELLARL